MVQCVRKNVRAKRNRWEERDKRGALMRLLLWVLLGGLTASSDSVSASALHSHRAVYPTTHYDYY